MNFNVEKVMMFCASPHTIVKLTLLKWYGGMSRVMLDGEITFKTNDVKDLIIKGFKTITPEKWTNFCNHVENKIEPQY
jgi:hypothetical protein